MKKYNVILCPDVIVKVTGVEANSQTGAIEVAMDQVDWYGLFQRVSLPKGVEYVEFNEGFWASLVDEDGDEQYERSRWYGRDGETPLPPADMIALLRLFQEYQRLRSDRAGHDKWEEFDAGVAAALGQSPTAA